MNKPLEEIKDYLEKAYTGAKAMNDVEAETKIERAIAALQSDPEKDIFTNEFKKEFIEMQINASALFLK